MRLGEPSNQRSFLDQTWTALKTKSCSGSDKPWKWGSVPDQTRILYFFFKEYNNISQNAPMCVSLSVCLFFPLSHSVQRSFSPTSRSPMSKLVWFLESLGKSNRKKRYQIKKKNTLAHKRCKITKVKKVFFYGFFSICLLHLHVFFSPLPEVKCPNFWDFQNPLGKKWKEVVSDLTPFAHGNCGKCHSG